jgi:hypothetical protein
MNLPWVSRAHLASEVRKAAERAAQDAVKGHERRNHKAWRSDPRNHPSPYSPRPNRDHYVYVDYYSLKGWVTFRVQSISTRRDLFRTTISPKHARSIAHLLIECADELENR